MSDDDRTDAALEESARQPLDETDASLLRDVADLLVTVDPVPTDLVSRVQFALALDEVFDEVARITRMPVDALAVRGEQVAGTRTETLTFSAERLTAMVTVSRVGVDRVRIDGWVAPPGELRVRLRMQGDEPREVRSDADGRFVLDGLPDGFAQLSFHPLPADGAEEGDPSDDQNSVVTPLFQL